MTDYAEWILPILTSFGPILQTAIMFGNIEKHSNYNYYNYRGIFDILKRIGILRRLECERTLTNRYYRNIFGAFYYVHSCAFALKIYVNNITWRENIHILDLCNDINYSHEEIAMSDCKTMYSLFSISPFLYRKIFGFLREALP